MPPLLDRTFSRIVWFLGSPYTNILVSVLGGLASCFSLLWFYYPNHIDPSLAASGLSDKLSSPSFLNACVVTMSIGGLLLLDLILDISAFLIEYRTVRKKPTIDKEKANDQLQEYLVRFLYISCVLVASVSIWTGIAEYRCILGYFSVRFRNTIMFGVTMFTVVDTFRQHGVVLKWICFSCRYQCTKNDTSSRLTISQLTNPNHQ